MKESTRNLLVGLFVLAALVVLGRLMMWFGEAPSWLGGSEWTLRITGVDGLSGISAGSPVNLNGVEIGRIKSLDFEDRDRPHEGVVIVAGIKNIYSVPADAVAKVYGATLGFGTGRIDIICEPGSQAGPLDKELATISGEMKNVMGELITKDLVGSVETTITHIGELAAAASPVMDNLVELIEQRSVADVEQPGAAARGVNPNLATAVERIDKLVANINAVLGDDEVQNNVKAAIGELKAAAEELRKTLAAWTTETRRTSENLNTGIDRTEENLEESFAGLNRVFENLDESSKTMARLLRRVEEGEGTAGRFLRDDRLYEAAVLALERLGELAGTLQRIFGKAEQDGYITIGKATPVGTITRDVPLPELVRKVRSKFARNDPADRPTEQELRLPTE